MLAILMHLYRQEADHYVTTHPKELLSAKIIIAPMNDDTILMAVCSMR
jgi:hypothetical protein